MNENICILLTASIAPENVPFLLIIDSKKRESQYLHALKFYLEKTPYKIIFVENTGYNLEKFRIINVDNRVEFLQFDARLESSKFGKGYGEMMILKYAYEHSEFLKNTNWIFKISGRLILKNIITIVKENWVNKEVNIFADLKGYLFFADSRCFMFEREFCAKYLFNLLNEINDNKSRDFEQVLAKAILLFLADGFKWQPLAKTPLIYGFSGTDNRKYASSYIYYLSKYFERKSVLKNFRFF